MKTTIKILIIFAMTLMLGSCEDPGVTTKRLTGAEDNLPYELRGLKVYSVSLGEGNWVKVAVLNDKINSLTYSEGKTETTTIIVNNGGNERVIKGTILSETDEIIVIKK